MLLPVLSVKDEATELYGSPITVNTTAEGLRAFVNAVNNPQHDMNKNPEDYTLWVVGTYNNETGELAPTTPHRRLMRGTEAMKGFQA